jgi:hypothetical protein
MVTIYSPMDSWYSPLHQAWCLLHAALLSSIRATIRSLKLVHLRSWSEEEAYSKGRFTPSGFSPHGNG